VNLGNGFLISAWLIVGSRPSLKFCDDYTTVARLTKYKARELAIQYVLLSMIDHTRFYDGPLGACGSGVEAGIGEWYIC